MRYIVLLLLLIPSVSAFQSIDILSVNENDNNTGNVASAHLATRPGSGAVFIDSYPLTRLDTQLSVRFARDYACDLADLDCSGVDFFYTIRTGSTIIGGPSAGAALTVLSYSELLNLDIDRSITMTGTITGSGLIGPVGGIQNKVLAARNAGFSTVLIPEAELADAQNISGITVIGVSTIEEAIEAFTGEQVVLGPATIDVPQAYTAQMEDVSVQLCERSDTLAEQVQELDNQTEFWLIRAAESSAQGKFYSAASFCFSANLALQEHVLESKSQNELEGIVGQLSTDIEVFDKSLPQEFTNIGDLEVFMVVRERLVESYDTLEDLDMRNMSSSEIAYALERYSSAVAWSSFFGTVQGDSRFENEWLEVSCAQNIAAAQEQINYVTYLTGFGLDAVQDDIGIALEYQRQGEWALCLFSASKVRAEAQSIITVAYSGEVLNATIEQKLDRAQQLLARTTQDGVFPIMSYAYYEYATELENVYSKNLYSEYSIALSSLEIYQETPNAASRIDTGRVVLLAAGLIIGCLLGMLVHSGIVALQKRK